MMFSIRKVMVFCFVFVFTAVGPAYSKNGVMPSPNEVLKQIFRSRESIKAGHFTVEEKVSDIGKPPGERQWEVYFDGSKLRADKNDSMEIVCLDCYSKYTRLYYSMAKPSLGEMKNALTFYDGYESPAIRFAIPNPKWFGYLLVSYMGAIDTQLTLIYDYDYEKNKYELQISPDVLNGQECWKIVVPSPLSSGKSIITIWVDRDVYDHIFQTECHLPVGSDNAIDYLDRLEIQGEMWDEKFWFPSKASYQRFENGKAGRHVETNIKIHSLGKHLPSDIFSPASIVKPDTPVAWHLDRDRPVEKGELVWDGKEIVAVDEFGKMMRESTRFRPFNIFLMLLGAALICFGIGLKLREKGIL